MITIEKLFNLVARCKGSVCLEFNAHRNNYQSVQEYLAELDERECPPEIPDGLRTRIVEVGTLVELQFYPRTPIGFHLIYHHDLDSALDLALRCFASIEEVVDG